MPVGTVLIPGLACGPRLYTEQLPALWDFGPVTVADHTRDDSIPAIAQRVLDTAPPQFALAGLAMGGYIALEIMRQQPERVARLALLGTSAQPPGEKHFEHLTRMIALAESGHFAEVSSQVFPTIVHADRRHDQELRRAHATMVAETGAEAYVRQVRANRGRIDSRPSLAAIACPTLVLVGDDDQKAPLAHAEELAEGIPDARLVVVERCGHLSTMEQPAKVNEALSHWMST
ncbi:alpha/beta fold hydrolase [Streptomyces sp. NPDC056983]|uniref:alpha/beta fold hydrolase n=1 Tax=Streptomyces sp. NPDC056983 TaxID=3345987 RepID=UPI003634532F